MSGTVTCVLTKGEHTVTFEADNLPDMLQKLAIAWPETDPGLEDFKQRAMIYVGKQIMSGALTEEQLRA